MEEIEILINEGDYKIIEERMNKIGEDDIGYQYLKGIIYTIKKEYKEAYRYLFTCYLYDTEKLEYLEGIINVNYKLMNYFKTIEFCDKYLQIWKKSAIYYILGECLMHVRKYEIGGDILYDKCYIEGYNVYNTLENLINCAFNTSNIEKVYKYCEEYKKIENINEDRRIAIDMIYKLYIDGNMKSKEYITKSREMFKENIGRYITSGITIKEINNYNIPWTVKMGFPLSYHHMNNCEIYKEMSYMYRTICPQMNYIAEHCTEERKEGKLRVGFISGFFREHSVSKDRRGIIKMLDRKRYEVYTIFANNVVDHIGEEIWASTIPIKLNYSTTIAKEQIEGLKLDILIYCEIGMNMQIYILSHYRLAPVQINTWGHSDTSGVNTIDYYISSRLYEIEEKPEEHYTEKLIMNEGLCTYYYNPIQYLMKAPYKNEDIMKTFKGRNIYICPGTIIKFHPIMDEIFKKILERDENGVIVLINDNIHNKEYGNRLKTVLGEKMNRIGFIPVEYNINYFMSILMAGDIILDTYPFGGCNTSLEAFSIGKPVVTLPGEYINGRFTYGFYKKMGIMELIAKDIDDYVEIAVKMCEDKEYNKKISKEIIKRGSILYENIEAVNEWNEMLERLYKEKTKKMGELGELKEYISYYTRNRRPIAHVWCETSLNYGDSMIWYSQKKLLEELGANIVYECADNNIDIEEMKRCIGKEGIVLMKGGGDFNNLYKYHLLRLKIIEEIQDNIIIQLPQSIFFDIKEESYERTKRIIEGNKKLIIIARDIKSLNFVRNNFTTTKVLLFPDVIHTIDIISYNPPKKYNYQKDIMIILRLDNEGDNIIRNEDKSMFYKENIVKIFNIKKKMNIIFDNKYTQMTYEGDRVLITDWYFNKFDKEEYNKMSDYKKTEVNVMNAIDIMKLGKVIISDRLHGYLLALILKIPHVIIDNNNNKLSAYYKTWGRQSTITYFAKTLEEAYSKSLEILDKSDAF